MNDNEMSMHDEPSQGKAHAHSHHKSHSHDHHGAPQNFNSAFALAVLLNFGFVIIEVVYAVLANSMSLLADAGHNLGDVLGLILAGGANILLAKGATERYSYGFRRTTIIAALINALILVATSTIIAYESIFKLVAPQSLNEVTIIIVALIGIVINGGTALLFMRGRNEDLNIRGAFLHLAYDALISFGVVIAGIIILYTGWLRLDAIVGLFIVVIILAGTWGLLRDSVNLILDAVPRGIDQKGIRHYLATLQGVTMVHDLHIWGLSTNEIALTAHLVMPDRQLHDVDFQKINHHLKHQFNIDHVTIQIEKGTDKDLCGQATTC